MIGIHTPEFEFEKNRSRVEKAVKRYDLRHPILMDNDYAYWRALGNRYWPTFYLVDRDGAIAARISGEMHEGDDRAAVVEELIEKLLAKT